MVLGNLLNKNTELKLTGLQIGERKNKYYHFDKLRSSKESKLYLLSSTLKSFPTNHLQIRIVSPIHTKLSELPRSDVAYNNVKFQSKFQTLNLNGSHNMPAIRFTKLSSMMRFSLHYFDVHIIT